MKDDDLTLDTGLDFALGSTDDASSVVTTDGLMPIARSTNPLSAAKLVGNFEKDAKEEIGIGGNRDSGNERKRSSYAFSLRPTQSSGCAYASRRETRRMSSWPN